MTSASAAAPSGGAQVATMWKDADSLSDTGVPMDGRTRRRVCRDRGSLFLFKGRSAFARAVISVIPVKRGLRRKEAAGTGILSGENPFPVSCTLAGFMRSGGFAREFQSPRDGWGPYLDTPPSIGQGVFDRNVALECPFGGRREEEDRGVGRAEKSSHGEGMRTCLALTSRRVMFP